LDATTIVAGIRRLHKEAQVEEEIIIIHQYVDALTGETRPAGPPIRVKKSGGRRGLRDSPLDV